MAHLSFLIWSFGYFESDNTYAIQFCYKNQYIICFERNDAIYAWQNFLQTKTIGWKLHENVKNLVAEKKLQCSLYASLLLKLLKLLLSVFAQCIQIIEVVTVKVR